MVREEKGIHNLGQVRQEAGHTALPDSTIIIRIRGRGLRAQNLLPYIRLPLLEDQCRIKDGYPQTQIHANLAICVTINLNISDQTSHDRMTDASGR